MIPNESEWLAHYQGETLRRAQRIAHAVVKARTEAKLSQRKLAALTGLKQPAIARLERGESVPTDQTLAKLSAILGEEFT